jgi:hypothetical protein
VNRCSVVNPAQNVLELQQLEPEQVDTWSACASRATLIRTQRTYNAMVSYSGNYASCEDANSHRLGQAANVSSGMIRNESRYEYSKVVQ